MNEQQMAARALEANRRGLALLDNQIAALAQVRPDVTYEDYRQPYFYSALGSDGDVGVLLSGVSTDTASYGFIRVQPDAAFVLTGIQTAISAENVNPASGSFGQKNYAAVRGPVGLRFYDESSSRWISFTNFNNEPQQRAYVPANLFSSVPEFNEGGLDMPAECVFPRSAVIRVEAYVLNTNIGSVAGTTERRLHVVFHGYKVFGG